MRAYRYIFKLSIDLFVLVCLAYVLGTMVCTTVSPLLEQEMLSISAVCDLICHAPIAIYGTVKMVMRLADYLDDLQKCRDIMFNIMAE